MEFKINDSRIKITENIDYLFNITENRKVLLLYPSKHEDFIHEFTKSNFIKMGIKDGERGKSLRTYEIIMKKLIENDFQKNDAIVGIGGGSLLDLAGFVASTYKRGIMLINVPTTLLAMVDASFGGKNAINFSGIKNVIGTFYHPSAIYLNFSYINSLEKKQILSGMGEIIKYAATMDKNLFGYIEKNIEKIMEKDLNAIKKIVYRSIYLKYSIVKKDEKGKNGIRDILNAGHTLGHAYESITRYRIPHGIAVSYGLVDECNILSYLGYADNSACMKIKELISKIGIKRMKRFPAESLWHYIQNDKKMDGDYIRIPAIVEIGRSEILNLNRGDLRDAIFESGSFG